MKRISVLLLVVLACTVYSAEKKEDEKEKDKKESLGTVIGIDLGTTYSW